jgi:hypothetical protein
MGPTFQAHAGIMRVGGTMTSTDWERQSFIEGISMTGIKG